MISPFIRKKLRDSSVSLSDTNLQRCEFFLTLSTASTSFCNAVRAGKSNRSLGSLFQRLAALSVKNFQAQYPNECSLFEAFSLRGRARGRLRPSATRGRHRPARAASGVAAGWGRARGKARKNRGKSRVKIETKGQHLTGNAFPTSLSRRNIFKSLS